MRKRVRAHQSTERTVTSALEVVTAYSSALAAGDAKLMNSFHADDYVLDMVHRDAFASDPLQGDSAGTFWPSWFASFPEMDYQVVRSIISEQVVVTQWVFMGTNTGPLTPPVVENRLDATGKTVRFRGVTFYDVVDGFIQRETLYIDLGTVLVELGVML